MTAPVARTLPRALAVAGLWLVPALAAGPGHSPYDLCREAPPASARDCRMAADLLMQAEPVPKVDLTVRVTAERGSLSYHYEAAGRSGAAEGCDAAGALVLPAGRRVRLLVTSGDAIYAWRVAELGIAVDLIPGRINEVRLDSLRTGQTVRRGRLEGAGGTGTEISVRIVGDGHAPINLQSLCGG